MASEQWKVLLRRVAVKTTGLALALLLGIAGAYLVMGSLVSAVASHGGREARVTAVSDHVGMVRTAFGKGGLFKVSVHEGNRKFDGVYCLYPAWPDYLRPSVSDAIQVWPPFHPKVGSVLIGGLGWLFMATLFLLGLIFLEFSFLCFTVRS